MITVLMYISAITTLIAMVMQVVVLYNIYLVYKKSSLREDSNVAIDDDALYDAIVEATKSDREPSEKIKQEAKAFLVIYEDQE